MNNTENSPKSRPLSPHLQIYKPTISMIMSVMHRLTGLGLYFGVSFLLFWFLSIISGPEIPVGKTCSTPVSLIDIYPTILECVGEPLLEKEKKLPGRSLQMIANEPDDNERKVFSEYHGAGSPSAVYMLRMGKYKYISYLGYSPELFNLELDPEEEENLANEKKYSELVKKFDTLLNDILNPVETDKKAKFDQAALIARLGGKEAILQKKTFAGTPPPKI